MHWLAIRSWLMSHVHENRWIADFLNACNACKKRPVHESKDAWTSATTTVCSPSQYGMLSICSNSPSPLPIHQLHQQQQTSPVRNHKLSFSSQIWRSKSATEKGSGRKRNREIWLENHITTEMWKTILYWNIQDDYTKKPHIPIPQNSGHWHFMGALTLSFLFFEGAIFIGPSPIFLEHWALPNRSTSLNRHMG